MKTLVVALVLLCLTGYTVASGWSYSGNDGPTYWSDTYSYCDDSSQSPIDIETDDVEHEDLGEFTLSGFDDLTSNMTLVNNGHALEVTLEGDYSTTGGGLDGTYTATQFHFHWGSSLSQGSEHSIDGSSYPAEMHIVHYNDMYSSISVAILEPEGLAVLGFFIEEGTSDNDAFDTLLSAISNVEYYGDTYDFPTAFSVLDLLPSDLTEFYRYDGSLTTPECNEVVVWTMFKEPILLSESQIAMFRTVYTSDNDTIEDNFRPSQDLNDRIVYKSDSVIITPSILVFFLGLTMFSVAK